MNTPIRLALAACCLLSAPVFGQSPASKPSSRPASQPTQDAKATSRPVVDDFKREGKPAARAKKDPLEGRRPPALQVAQWMNVEDKGIDLDALRGKVIAIKFWGVW